MDKLLKGVSFCMLLFSLILTSCDSGQRNEDQRDTVNNEQARQGQQIQENTNEFVKNAASSGMMEVEAGRIAQQKANNQQVKDFAQQLVNDHQNANDKLKNLAQQNNINLPQQMQDDHKQKVEELNNTSAQEFDKKYMDMVVNAHEKDINNFEDAKDDIQNQDIKNWVNETLPHLRNHLDKAKQINESVQNNQ